VQIFTIAFQRPIEFGIATALVLAILLTVMFSAISAEGAPPRWVRAITSPNAKVLFGLLFVAWAVVFGIGLQLVPHEGANSPYGGLGLIALFSGFFIMMGFLWAVIGE
jgi:succinate dehydrogenase hydrophobic anchor subunit